MNGNSIFCCGWILSVLGAILLVISVSTPYWRGHTDSYEGIFQRCSQDKCKQIEVFQGREKELDAIRILLVISLGYIGLEMFLAVFSVGPKRYVALFGILAFLHCAGAFSMYTYFYRGMTWKWSFYLGWIGCGFYGIGFIVLFTSACCEPPVKEVTQSLVHTN